MKKKLLNYIVFVFILASLGACRSTKSVQQGREKDNVAELIDKNLKAREGLNALSAKLNVTLLSDGKELSVGGTLRMKRDDVIQISLSAFFVEVARLEITPDYILVLDRLGKQYVKTTYREQAFLERAGLDFKTLQALFWGRLFVPGRGEDVSLSDFVLLSDSSDDQLILQLQDLKQTGLSFTLGRPEGETRRVEFTDTKSSGSLGLSWDYNNYKTVDKATFPGQMVLQLNGMERPMKATLSFSSLKQDDNWAGRTQISSKYKQVSVDLLLKRLLKL